MLKKEGYQCLYGKETEIFEQLDKIFVSFLDGYDVDHFTIPALLDSEVLKRCNYFESFPHHLSLVATVKKENLATVSAQKCVDDKDAEIHSKVLTPAACLHIYPMIEGQQIEEKIITTRARVYRYEGNRYNETGRLWDYTVREIVFVGRQEYVRYMLTEIQEKALAYAKQITNDATLLSSSDIFFDSRKNCIKKKLQIANEKKYELVIPVDGTNVAVSSFNFHGNHFSGPFSFDNNNTVVSGCVGFGIERWLLAKLFYERGAENE
jgi:seryl-tRNA synthetase